MLNTAACRRRSIAIRTATAETATSANANVTVTACTHRAYQWGRICMLRVMQVTLPDGNAIELPDGASGLDAAQAIGPRLAQAAVAVEVGGQLRDLRLPLADGETVRILTARDPEALAVLRHSTAHVLAQAVPHLWPDAKVAIGPAIADGFYYDFEFPEPVLADDLGRIDAEMRRILKTEQPFVRTDGVAKAELAAVPRRVSRTSSSWSRPCRKGRSASTRRTASRTCVAARTCRPPSRSRPSSCSRSPAPTGAATRTSRC